MRKLNILFFILITSITSVAQEFSAGPLLGTSFSQVDGDNFGGYNKVGINLGAFVSRTITEHWDIQLDIAYMQKGSREAPNPEKGKYDDYKIHLSYIQFPLVGRYQYKQFSAEGGLSVGTLLSSKEEIDGTPIGELPSHSVVPFQDIEWATIFGFNYHFTDKLWVNARWFYSINRIRIPYDGEIPVYNPKPHWISRKPGQYNNNFVVSLYYKFDKLL
ncbi:PorT family protein [Carboxylicivirga sediminis]|uniref:PorT family protein n=1 Tax=Carboxylicivirga sediminis TaxID=2006564 RepID=A0A941F897_9BACT|nr:porin family protein [Carboxylicivirga sediminis]MBR8537065.1 PorT family protein [Carboxylicivirga sediminis]